MDNKKFQEKLNRIDEIIGEAERCGDFNYRQGLVLGMVLDCLEDLSMEISRLNNEN